MKRPERSEKTGDRGRSDPRRPTQAEIAAAHGKSVADVIAPGLRVLFCGINPSLYSAAVGHHFARPGNRFWPSLHAGGLTDRVLRPHEEDALRECGYGITNIVDRATARADELSKDELVAGGVRLEAKVRRLRPGVLAVLGVTAYRTAFDRPRALLGPQADTIAGAAIWVLPNPSGLNASFTLDQFHALADSLALDGRG
jgi:TDG/mug DNA glycosylase family protein